MDVFAILYIGSLVLAIPLGLIFYPTWYFAHKPLCTALDPVLFREPFFNKDELRNYQYHPLCLIKSANYMYLIATPSLAKRKRFRHLETDPPVKAGLRLLSRMYIYTAFIGTAVAVLFFSLNAYIFFAM